MPTSPIEDHMLRHYEMVAFTMTGGQAGTALNIMDLIYYHTYGDYRMVYVPPKSWEIRQDSIQVSRT